MKKNIFLVMMIFVFLLTACKKETVELTQVEAIVKEIDIENESLLVEGIGEDNPLGDSSLVDIKGAEIEKAGEKADLSDIKIGDKVALEIGEVEESYPTKTKSEKVNILEEDKIDEEVPAKEDEVPVKEDGKPEKEDDEFSKKEEIGRIFIKESVDKITIYSQGMNISKLNLLALEYDEKKDTLVEKESLKEKVDIKPGEKTTWEVVYGEGVPSMKLVWKLSSGKSGEYIIAYNGKYGRNPDKTIIYYNNGEILEEYEKMEEEGKTEIKDVKLYFILFDEADAYLVEEIHEVENVSGIARLTLETLRDVTPKTKNATNPIHESTLINNIYIEDRNIVVDFSKAIEKSNYGSTAEALQVQAIVNTLTQFPTVDGVIFKVDGNEDIEGWLSHIGNVDKPFTEDMSLVKQKALD